ncbi:unnamed protein product [Microthlaspi erraticum]|uniref:Retrotransposon gag domain-containing protein n=1 Tax=Microthlaspi erraticum TaxID=1685480 RepID=A0A6D2HE94_9BRAS|nr:unnamed protein product [Microthlaspi erraticum]
MNAVISTFHQCVKFPTPSGIFTLRRNQRVTRSCFLRERKLRTASSFMVIEPSNQSPREEPEPTSDTTRRATIARVETLPIPPRRAGTEPTSKSDLSLSMSTKNPKKLLGLFEMEQLEDDLLRSYLDRFKSMLLDLDEIPGAPPISETALIQAFRNGLWYHATTQGTPQCAFTDQEIFEIIADIRRTPLTSRLSEVPLKKRILLHLSFYDGRDIPKQWISSLMIAIRRQRYASLGEQSALLCQALAEHLPREALTWFGSLRADSIDSFDDLALAFLKQHLRFALDDLVFQKSDEDRIDHLGKFGFS